MTRETMVRACWGLLAGGFMLVFGWVVVPAVWVSGDVWGVVAGGFVNPFAAGYSVDVVGCWLVLVVWVVSEWGRVRWGWVALLVGLVPGVTVGLVVYLLLRQRSRGLDHPNRMGYDRQCESVSAPLPRRQR